MKRRIAGSVLIFEAIVIILAIPVAINVAGVAPGPAIGLGLALAVAAIVVAARVDRRGGVAAGWAIQGLVIASALVVPVMAVLGAMFAGLWFAALRLLAHAQAAQPDETPATARGAVEES